MTTIFFQFIQVFFFNLQAAGIQECVKILKYNDTLGIISL